MKINHDIEKKESENIQNMKSKKKQIEKTFFENDIDLILNCRRCDAQFYFNNKLHRHFKKNCLITMKKKLMITMNSNLLIIHSTREHDKSNDLIFRSRQYVKIKFSTSSKTGIMNKFCVDNDIFMSLMNKEFVINKCLNIKISKTTKSIKVRGIEKTVHDNFEYVVMNFYIIDTIKSTRSLTHFKAEVYLINDLKINVLLRVDVLISKKMVLNFERGKMIIFTCKKFEVEIIIVRKFEKIIKSMRSSNKIIVSTEIIIFVSMHIKKIMISNDINYNFFFKIQFTLSLENDFFAHVIEFKLIVVQVRNASKYSYIMLKNFKMSKFCDYAKKDSYIIESKECYLTIVSQFTDVKKIINLSKLFSKETILPNEITIYDDTTICRHIFDVMKVYSKI